MKNYYNLDKDIIHYEGEELKLFSALPQQQWMKDYVKENLIVLYVGGSHSYGLNTKDSDIDVRGIFKDNIDMVLGLNKIEQISDITNDITIYSFTKMIDLIANQNPNAMEALWVDESEILYKTEAYDYLRSKREDLLSTLVKHKYSGYAISQLKRIRNSNKKVMFDLYKKEILKKALDNKDITLVEIEEYYGRDFNLSK